MSKQKTIGPIQEWCLFYHAELGKVVICDDEDFETAPVFGGDVGTVNTDRRSAEILRDVANNAIQAYQTIHEPGCKAH